MEKIFANHISDRAIIAKIDKKVMQLSNKCHFDEPAPPVKPGQRKNPVEITSTGYKPQHEI